MIGLDAPVAVGPPGDEVTVYATIGEPPSDAGAAKLTDAWPAPAVAVTPVGAPGRLPAGRDGVVGADVATCWPMASVSVTLALTVIPRSAPVSRYVLSCAPSIVEQPLWPTLQRSQS